MLQNLRKLLICALALMLAAVPFAVSAADEAPEPLLSPGLCVIAARSELVVSSLPGGDAIFTADDFARAVGYLPERITLTQSPSSAVGQLTMGGIVIPEGQVLSAQNFGRISFAPSAAPAAQTASFSFSADGSAYDYTCIVRLRTAENREPSLESATAAALSASVPESGICAGRLAASDPDGDALVFEITEYPRHGSVILTDRASGRYVYRPTAGYTGRDSFSYTARDEWGAYAGEAQVSLTVSRFGAPDFADMSGSAETFARIVTAEGLMSGTIVGGEAHFYPDGGVSRSEFTVNLLIAAGFKGAQLPENTPFADNDAISASARPYVAKAYELGLTDGWIVDGRQVFAPNEAISLAEAARMTARLLGLDVALEVSAPLGSAAWAKGEIAALCNAGFGLDAASVSPSKMLDRAAAAEILCGMIKIKEAGR